MNDLNVPAEPAGREPSVWADISAELHKLAEDALTLVGETAPFLMTINIQPRTSAPDRAAQVDAVAEALLGKPGAPVQMSSGAYHQDAEGWRGPIKVKAFTSIPAPHETELARLRAENEQLRAAARQAYVTDPADPFDADSQAGRGSAW